MSGLSQRAVVSRPGLGEKERRKVRLMTRASQAGWLMLKMSARLKRTLGVEHNYVVCRLQDDLALGHFFPTELACDRFLEAVLKGDRT